MLDIFVFFLYYIIIINIPFILLFIVPFILALIAIKKKKSRMLKITATFTAVIVVVSVASSILFPTAYPYVDWWIYGKTRNEIMEVYDGEWSNWGQSEYQRAPHSFLGYYSIHFNDKGLAESVNTADSEP